MKIFSNSSIHGFVQLNKDGFCNDECYHVNCFFEIHHPHTAAAFDGFAELRETDRLTIREHLGE